MDIYTLSFESLARVKSLVNYFLLLRYTAVYRDFGDTGIVTQVSTISIEVSRVSHNTSLYCFK